MAVHKTPRHPWTPRVRIYEECLVTGYSQGTLTATGTKVRVGECAVDPNVISLGSELWIPEYSDKYGWTKAEDTGGLIKGNRIDVYLPRAADCKKWGVRMEEVVVRER